MDSNSSEETMFSNKNLNTVNIRQNFKSENQDDDINDENVSAYNDSWENDKRSQTANNVVLDLSLQRNGNVNNIHNLRSSMEVDISVTASVQKRVKESFSYFEVPVNSEGRGDDYVYPEEITIKEEKEDKDNEESLITLEIKLENEEIPEVKEPELDSCHINDPEEILPTNDYYRLMKPMLGTDPRSYVAKNCRDTYPEYDFCGNDKIEEHLQSQTKTLEHSENSISCFENAENILPTISEENAEEILPTVDSSKDNLLEPTTLQPSNFKQKYKCSECYASYKSLSRYRSHKKQHRYTEAQKSIKRYRNTMKRLTNVRGFPHFQCDKCDQKYIYVTSLEKHMLNCHAPFPVKLVKGSEILNDAENSNIGTVNWNGNDSSEKVLPTNDLTNQPENNTLTYSETSELEGIMNNILKLQQCSVDASRDMLNEIEKKYECPNCHQSYKNSSTYRQHLHKHIKDEKLFLARRKAQISRRHAKANRGFTHFKCEKCNKKYSLLTSLKKHMKNCLIEVKDESHDYICTCKKIFSTESDMLVCFKGHETKPVNMNVDNSDENDTVKWPLTDSYISLLKDDSTAEALLNNIKLLEKDITVLNSKMSTILESSHELYECPKCFMSYSISRSYRQHLNRHLSQTNRTLKKTKMVIRMKLLKARNVYADFICDGCKYISTDSKDLENHRMTCHIGQNLENSVNTFHQSDTNTCIKAVSLQTQDSRPCNLEITPGDSACTNLIQSHSLENSNNLNVSEQVTNDFDSKEIWKSGETQKIHRCPKCSLFYINFSEFQQHLSKHNEEEMRILPKKMRVKTMRQFKESTNFKCEKCDKIYVYEESLNRHMRQCQKSARSESFEMNVYPCSCGKTFSRKTRMESCLLSHGTKFSDTSTSVIECNVNTADGVQEILSTRSVCIKDGTSDLNIDSNKTSIQQEETSNINEMSNKMSLSQTQTIFKCEQHVANHLRGDESEQDKDTGIIAVKRVKDVRGLMLYKCNQCDRTYMHKGSLESHVNSQHKTEDMIPVISEEYPCTCGKVFVRKSRMETCLKNHSVIDQGKLPYCSSCSYYFENLFDLHLHKTVAHMNDRLLCKMCPMEYSTPSHLFDHLKLHQNVQFMEHKIVEEYTEENQKFKCFVCESDLSDLTELKFHFLNDHKQPYSCKNCDKMFQEIESFMLHTKTVHLSSEELSIIEFLEALHKLSESWKCEPCKFQCENPDELADHMHSHKTMNAIKFDPFKRLVVDTRKYRCMHCRRLFKAPSNVRHHVELYHDICDLRSKLQKQEFYQYTKCNKKELVTTTPVNQNNTCFMCKIQFVSETHLKWHLSTQKHIDIKSCLLNEQFFQEISKRAASPEPTPKFFEVMLIKQEYVDDSHSDNE